MLANLTVKACTKCGEEKHVSLFNKGATYKDGKRPYCRSCDAIAGKAHRLANKEKIAAKSAEYYKRNKAAILKNDKKWREKNKAWYMEWRAARATDINLVKEKRNISRLWYANNSETAKEKQREYYKNNKDKSFSKTAKRRALKLQAMPLWANERYIKLWFKFAKIEAERTGQKVEVDHIIPLQGVNVCGLHCEDNMQLLFMADNRSKGNKLIVCGGDLS